MHLKICEIVWKAIYSTMQGCQLSTKARSFYEYKGVSVPLPYPWGRLIRYQVGHIFLHTIYCFPTRTNIFSIALGWICLHQAQIFAEHCMYVFMYRWAIRASYITWTDICCSQVILAHMFGNYFRVLQLHNSTEYYFTLLYLFKEYTKRIGYGNCCCYFN